VIRDGKKSATPYPFKRILNLSKVGFFSWTSAMNQWNIVRRKAIRCIFNVRLKNIFHKISLCSSIRLCPFEKHIF